MMNKSLLIFGTRPELIKIVPLINEFKKRSQRDDLILVHTNQHDSLVKQDLKTFNIKPDYQLNFKNKENNLTSLVGNLLLNLNELLTKLKSIGTLINCIISQGDTATTYCAALLAFHAGIPFYHVEAGLRTLDFTDPFPEEFYRKTISTIAAFHFAPTDTEYQNLIKEHIDASKILITGNTVIDNLKTHFSKSQIQSKKTVLITLHRREKGKTNRSDFIKYFSKLASKNKDWNFLWILHPSMQITDYIKDDIPNLAYLEAVSYLEILKLYEETSIIYTDSGGIQEEAGYLGIPCVIARNETERKQGVKGGLSFYLDFNEFNIMNQLDKYDRNKLTFKNTLYGNGNSADMILNQLLKLNRDNACVELKP